MEFSLLKSQVQKIVEFVDDTEIEPNGFASGWVEIRHDGLHLRRPVYVFFGTEYLVVDAPFALAGEVENAENFAALWGIGVYSGKLTIHNTFLVSTFENNLPSLTSAIKLMVSEAASREFEIIGERLFLVSETPAALAETLKACDECGNEVPEDEITYYDEEDDGEWIGLCEDCSLK